MELVRCVARIDTVSQFVIGLELKFIRGFKQAILSKPLLQVARKWALILVVFFAEHLVVLILLPKMGGYKELATDTVKQFTERMGMLILGEKYTANLFARIVFHPPVKTRGLPHFPEVLGETLFKC